MTDRQKMMYLKALRKPTQETADYDEDSDESKREHFLRTCAALGITPDKPLDG